jgi:hypothetical protein
LLGARGASYIDELVRFFITEREGYVESEIHQRVTFETLEVRTLFSAQLIGDVVCVAGTGRADEIRLAFRTVVNGEGVHVDQVFVNVNGEDAAFNLDEVGRILVKADGAADDVQIDQSLGRLPRVGIVPETGATATLARGVLNVEGSGRGDVIEISRDARRGGNYVVEINGRASTFAVAEVSRVLVFGNRRDDTILIGQSGARFAGDVIVVGGDGSDRITGGAGDDTIYGGLGKDTLTGGDGDDHLFAGGEAIVDGGAGDDQLTDFTSRVQFTGGAGHDGLSAGGSRANALSMFLDYDAAEDSYGVVPAS